MASSSSSPQEKSIASPKLYDAFISHRGPDVKHTLAKQLYERLKATGCTAFLDREEIKGGDSIPFAISNGICSSLVQIAIFSKGYATSSWCLDELVLMLEQKDALFIPVFYDVKPWELRHIENKDSQYATAFSDYRTKQRNLDKLEEWKKALVSAANISGYELSEHQDNLCENIVSRVLQEVQEKKNKILLDVAKYPVGLAELVQDFESFCSKTVKDKVKIVGIFGLGGSGKTTLAKELFNSKSSGYHASCFLSDVRESHARGELHCLQSQLLKDLFPEDPEIEGLEIRSLHHGMGKLKDCLGRARQLHFLIILDDIDHEDQLDALLPEGMLSFGSLVIITTRDQSVLRGADIHYKMKVMNSDLAKDLFCSHAFRGRDVPIAYEKLVESFVEFCGGLPLSLKVLGAHVYGRDEDYWELELGKVKNIQPKDIMQKLKISFDGLDSQEKQIFIDIACFFNKRSITKSKIISIWKASGWSAEHAVQNLQDKCLLEVGDRDDSSYYEFEMHDHVRDLGRQMAENWGPPRLWKPELLRPMEAKGFKQILAETKTRCFHYLWDSSLGASITYFIGSLNDSAETELLWLEMKGGSIPSWIPLRKLRCLEVDEMENLWSTFPEQLQINTQASIELRNLEIYHSDGLQNLPDSIGMFNHLEELVLVNSLEGTDITSLLQSLQQLNNLRLLCLSMFGVSLSGNFNLSRMNSLESMKISSAVNISKLLISGEICPKLRSLEVRFMFDLNEMELQQLETLNTLRVEACKELETISGLSSLTGLQSLTVVSCGKLETISGLSSQTGLQSLRVERCDKLETISGLSSLTGLQSLTVKSCSKLETISGLSSLTGLQSLRVERYDKLETISGLSSLTGLQSLTVWRCLKLETISGLEELQGLKNLVIQKGRYGSPSVWNCIYGLRRLPSKYTILVGKAEWSRLNANLFSEVIGGQAVAEIKSEHHMHEMRSSSSAITIYVLHVSSTYSFSFIDGMYLDGEWMVTGIVTEHNSNVSLSGVKIEKGFMVTVNKDEEGKALSVLQIIVNRLYGPSMVPKLAAYDAVKRKRKRKGV